MSKEKEQYLNQFSGTDRSRSLAGIHYLATYASQYWGKEGAIWVAKKLAEELRLASKEVEAGMLLLSTYYSAAGSALQFWKKDKWKVWYLWRAIWDTLMAHSHAEDIIRMYVDSEFRSKRDAEAWECLFQNFSDSQLEVLMSPYWAIAIKGARLGFLVGRERFTALLIGYSVLSSKAHEHELSYAFIAGKMMHLVDDTAERYKLKLVVMQATENKKFPAKDRARLHVLLGEHDKAKVLGEQENLQDVILKAGG